ncbi:MAG: hypothetical protein KC620_22720 [Myxococcales bacterium]|nr:hypothetical protein [Myxococcales bacterium]
MAKPLGQEDSHDRIQGAGRNVLLYTFSLLKTGEVHELNNEAWLRPTEKLIEALDTLFKVERQAVAFVVHEGIAQINSHALWLDRGSNDQAQELEQSLAKREAGGVIFLKKPREEQLRLFFSRFARFRAPPDAANQMTALQEDITAAGVEDLKLAPQPLRLEGVGQGVRGVASLWYYSKAVAGLNDLLRRVPVEVKAARRVAQELVDACAVEQDLLFALPLLGRERTPARRAVDAALMAAGFGRGLGLSAILCADLATIAALHASGTAYANPDPAEFTLDESAGVLAVRQLVEGSSFTPLLAQRVAAAIECALGPDRDGPPYLTDAPPPLLSSQLVALINLYIARVRGDGRPRESAMAVGLDLLRDPPKNIHPALVQVFVAVVGLLPVGTVVELNNGDLGVVADVEHLRGRNLYRKSPAPVSEPRKIFIERMRTEQGKVVPERRARVRLGDEGEAGEWAVRRTLVPGDDMQALVVRALVRQPATVMAQMGIR